MLFVKVIKRLVRVLRKMIAVLLCKTDSSSKLNRFITTVGPNILRRDDRIWWQELYQKPVCNIGESGMGIFQDIYSPLYSSATVTRYIHEQYLVAAKKTAERIAMTDTYRYLIQEAVQKSGYEVPDTTFNALDIGSGSGNTVFPFLQLFPNARMVATELSLDMLAILRGTRDQLSLQEKCAILQLNAEELDFAKESFHVIIGAAILHHLFDPSVTIEACSRILKPGGIAIFFEPFLPGNQVISQLFEDILSRSVTHPIPKNIKQALSNFNNYIQIVSNEDKSNDSFKSLDDKWLFRKEYFHKLAVKYKYSNCMIYRLYASPNQYELQINTILGVYSGIPLKTVPDWIMELIREYDKKTAEEEKERNLIEGCLILRK